ncbi:hypothetical protein GCM10011289_35630 [Paludibacterium paludis]|uniref:Peptidase M12A domain-containing protein n=1 Tax=Paludibacterium paludis TaxID=1225769 RepID=A0A918P748_9NEIS|nr:hypothetical protein GCM10011289_35630 [Paludibacterium paludis]
MQSSLTPVTVRVIGAHALVDDIIVGEWDSVRAEGVPSFHVGAPDKSANGEVHAATAHFVRTWPRGIVPYEFSRDYPESGKQMFEQAIRHYEEKTGIRFIPRNGHGSYIRLNTSIDACYTYLGMAHDARNIYMTHGCAGDMNSNLHELGHILGLIHEHQRADRDTYIRPSPFYKWSSQWVHESGTRELTPYDINSVMHYRSGYTMESGHSNRTLSRNALSPGDIRGLAQLYPEAAQRVVPEQPGVGRLPSSPGIPGMPATPRSPYPQVLPPRPRTPPEGNAALPGQGGLIRDSTGQRCLGISSVKLPGFEDDYQKTRLEHCDGRPSLRWYLGKDGKLRNTSLGPDQCLGGFVAGAGETVMQPCNGGGIQRWNLDAGRLRNPVAMNLPLAIISVRDGLIGTGWSGTPASNFLNWHPEGATAPPPPVPDRQYTGRLSDTTGHRCLSVMRNRPNSPHWDISMQYCNASPRQEWKLDGSRRLRSESLPGYCLGGDIRNQDIRMEPCSGDARQQWHFDGAHLRSVAHTGHAMRKLPAGPVVLNMLTQCPQFDFVWRASPASRGQGRNESKPGASGSSPGHPAPTPFVRTPPSIMASGTRPASVPQAASRKGLLTRATGQCLTVDPYGPARLSGTRYLSMQTCTGSALQRWELDAAGKLASAGLPGYCLDSESPTRGFALMRRCANGAAMRWNYRNQRLENRQTPSMGIRYNEQGSVYFDEFDPANYTHTLLWKPGQ